MKRQELIHEHMLRYQQIINTGLQTDNVYRRKTFILTRVISVHDLNNWHVCPLELYKASANDSPVVLRSIPAFDDLKEGAL